MPTIVGILIFMSRINSDLSLVEIEKKFYNLSACTSTTYDMSLGVSKPTICICENKDADQLHREADQRLSLFSLLGYNTSSS